MVQAYILIQTEVGKASTVAETISKIPGVIQAEDVTGPYDVIVRAQADTVDELGRMVVAKVQQVDGITRTLTCPVVHSVAPVYPVPVNFFRHRPLALPALALLIVVTGCSSADDSAAVTVPAPDAEGREAVPEPGRGAAGEGRRPEPRRPRAPVRTDRGLGQTRRSYCAAVSHGRPR